MKIYIFKDVYGEFVAYTSPDQTGYLCARTTLAECERIAIAKLRIEKAGPVKVIDLDEPA